MPMPMRLSFPASIAALVLGCATAPAVPRSPPAPDTQALADRCARGFPAECRSLGRSRLFGEGVARDERLGAALVTAACEMGDPGGCADLAVLYALGRAVPQSDERAAALSRRACEQGAANGCSNQGALLVEGAAAPAPLSPDRSEEARSGRVVRLFRTACDGGVPEGCLNLGVALEQGRIAQHDLGAAGSSYRRACDAGLAVACHRLAVLLGEHPQVAPDLNPTALEARACARAVAPACLAVNERSPEPGPRTPAARLVDDRYSFALGLPGGGGYHPAELSPALVSGPKRTLEEARRPSAAIQAAVPPELRARLGLDGPVGADGAEDPAVDELVRLRRAQLGACYEGPRTAHGRVELEAVFLVDGDGRAMDVRAAATPEDPGLEGCARDRIGEWEFPAAPGDYSGLHLVRFTFDPAPGAEPGIAGPGELRPSLRDPGCVDRVLEVPADYRAAVGAATVKLAVDGAGAPGLVHALTPVPEPVLAAIRRAVTRCEWAAGADSAGRPASRWVTLTVRLGR
jgi:hypothetical protein